MATANGRKVLKRRRAKGRAKLTYWFLKLVLRICQNGIFRIFRWCPQILDLFRICGTLAGNNQNF
jgi:hypothetical protein